MMNKNVFVKPNGQSRACAGDAEARKRPSETRVKLIKIPYLCNMIRDFYDIDLSGRNSFHVRQRAARLVEFETTDDLTAFFRKGAPAKWTVLAGGNNILFTQDFDGVLLTPRAASIDVVAETPDAVAVRAEAGVEWDDLVAWAVERDLWGIENLSLIPGKVGAAPVQNIGAYGAEAKDAIESVEMFCTDTCNTLILSREHCAFGYRESVFKHALRGRVVITAVTFRLSRRPRPDLGYGDLLRETEARGGATLRNIREAVCAIRRSKLPDTAVLGNAGSFFKNPVVEAAVAERLSFDIAGQVAQLRAERDAIARALAACPAIERVYPSDANFILVRTPDPDRLYDALIAAGVIVRNRSRIPGCEGCLRITVGTPEENVRMLETVKNFTL